MAISRQKKEAFLKQYIQDLQDSDNLVVLKQLGISVGDATKIRKLVLGAGGKINVVKKRIFLKAIKESGYQEIDLGSLDGSVIALFSKGIDYDTLKTVNNFVKKYKKDSKKTSLTYLGGRFDKKWFDEKYVDDLANVPSKEELLSKLVYLLNYPLQSFAAALDQISKKENSGQGNDVSELVQDNETVVKEDIKEEVSQSAEISEPGAVDSVAE